MSLNDIRRRLRSDIPKILIEAPAGCGKTHEAAELAVDLAKGLDRGQSVLVLTHTNAAVQEFSRRAAGHPGSVHATTIMSFCVEILEPYCAGLGLPSPLALNLGQSGAQVGFDRLAPLARDLVNNCQPISRALTGIYPVILFDEHQDATPDQHDFAKALAYVPSIRCRFFADPMQSIFGDGLDWEMLVGEVDATETLNHPFRWQKTPDLGAWILHARSELLAGNPLPLDSAPTKYIRITSLPDVGCLAHSPRVEPKVVKPIQQFLSRVSGSAAVLASTTKVFEPTTRRLESV